MRYEFLAGMIVLLAATACDGQPAPAATASVTPVAPEETPPSETIPAAPAVDLSAAPSGAYKTDPLHAYITFSYNHMGMSNPRVRWRSWTGELDWDAEDPTASAIFVEIDAASVDSGVDEFDGHLKAEKFFDVANYPEITFQSTSIERTGPNTGRIAGDLTIKGVTKPAVLDAVINGAASNDQAKMHALGFSATTTIRRSDFGVDAYTPYVSDDVAISIEAEFVMPYAEE